jgi:hypothetical protein
MILKLTIMSLLQKHSELNILPWFSSAVLFEERHLKDDAILWEQSVMKLLGRTNLISGFCGVWRLKLLPFLRCCTAWLWEMLTTFRRYLLPRSSNSKCVKRFYIQVHIPKNTDMRVGVVTSSRPKGAVDREICAGGHFKGHAVHQKNTENLFISRKITKYLSVTSHSYSLLLYWHIY